MRDINLLPPEIHEKEAARRRRIVWILLAVVFVGVLAFLTIDRFGKTGPIEDDIAAQEDRNAQIQTEIDQLITAEDVTAEFTQAVLALQLALVNDVSWGRILNDLGRVLPERVWLTNFQGSSNQTGESIGTVTLLGNSFTPEDVAEYIRVLESDAFPAFVGTWVASLNDLTVGDTTLVSFNSTSSLTEAALSGRAETRVPEVP